MEIVTDIIFLDTSIFESQNFLRGHKLNQLGQFSKDEEILVKITDIVYSEVLKRFKENLTKTKALFKNADRKFSSDGKILKNLDEFNNYYPMPTINVAENYEKLKGKLDSYLLENKIEIIDSKEVNVKEVFKKYFEKKAPFGEGQKKDEFPDAFILNAIEKWCLANNKKTYISSLDTDMLQYESNNNSIIPIKGLAEYLDAITRRKAEKSRMEIIDKLIQKNLNAVELRVQRNFEDDLTYQIYERFSENAWYEEVEYEPGTIESVKIKNYLITEIKNETLSIQFDVDIKLKATMIYNDLSKAIYDKEDRAWFNVEYIGEEKIYDANFRFIFEFIYEIEEGDTYIEFTNVLETELKSYVVIDV